MQIMHRHMYRCVVLAHGLPQQTTRAVQKLVVVTVWLVTVAQTVVVTVV